MGISVAEAARSLVGTPFRHRGRTRAGLDCAGVVWLARKMALGLSDDTRDYPPRPTSRMVLEGIGRFADRISLRDARDGDVAVLRYDSFVTHLGVLTPTTVIHAVRGLGVIETKREKVAGGATIQAVFRLRRGSWPL